MIINNLTFILLIALFILSCLRCYHLGRNARDKERDLNCDSCSLNRRENSIVSFYNRRNDDSHLPVFLRKQSD